MAIATNFSRSGSISASLSYGSNPNRKGAVLSVNCNPDKAIRDFSMPFKIYDKTKDDIKIHRLVLSFANDKKGNCEVNDYDSQEYVQKFLDVTDKHLNGNYPIIAYQHLNRNHMHYHIYVGACGLDGRKLHSKQNPITFCRRLNSSLSLQYGLKLMPSYRRNYRNTHQFTTKQINEYAKKHKENSPYSYKDAGRQFVSRAILRSSDLNSFTREMNHQGCKVSNNIYNDSKMLNIFIPYRYQNGERKKGQSFRNLRTRTLGNDFRKDEIKEAIYSNDEALLKKYRFFAKNQKTVQGGKVELPKGHKPAIIIHDRASSHMRNVEYKNPKMNFAHGINYGAKTMKSDYHANDLLMPNTAGLDAEERQTLINQYKFLKSLSNSLDGMIDSVGSIFNIFNKHISKNMDYLINTDNKINHHDNNIKMKYDYDKDENRKVDNNNHSQKQYKNQFTYNDLNHVSSRKDMINLIKKLYDNSNIKKKRYILSLSMMGDVNPSDARDLSNYYLELRNNNPASFSHGLSDMKLDNDKRATVGMRQLLHDVKQSSKNIGNSLFIDDSFIQYFAKFKGDELITRTIGKKPIKEFHDKYGSKVNRDKNKVNKSLFNHNGKSINQNKKVNHDDLMRPKKHKKIIRHRRFPKLH